MRSRQQAVTSSIPVPRTSISAVKSMFFGAGRLAVANTLPIGPRHWSDRRGRIASVVDNRGEADFNKDKVIGKGRCA